MEFKTEAEQRQILADAILRGRDGNHVAHAQRELAKSLASESGYDRAVAHSLIDMVRCFGTAGHSGFSAGWATSALALLLRYEPLGPLTGEPDEWTTLYYDEHMAAQNKRCSHVFRRADGTAYDGEGVIFREPSGACFTGRYSSVDVTFPYSPKRVYADVPSDYTDEQMVAARDLALAAA